MRQFIVIDIHPDDAFHERNTDNAVCCGDIITVKDGQPVELYRLTWKNCTQEELIGFQSGQLGDYSFFGVKVSEVHQPTIDTP